MESDYSNFIESAKEALASAQSAQAEYSKSIKEAFLATEGFMRAVADLAASAQEFGRQIYNANKPMKAATKLGDVQFVYWEYMEDEFIDEILDQEDIDSVLQKKFCIDNPNFFYEIVDKCLNCNYMDKYAYIFKQCEESYKRGAYDVAVIGLCTIIDGLLSDVTEDSISTSIKHRVDEIHKRLSDKDVEIVDNDEIAFFILMTTFNDTIEIFGQPSDFSNEEPAKLNRHWIMHGRSRREKTALDCIKILNIIYGILLIDSFIYQTDDRGKIT